MGERRHSLERSEGTGNEWSKRHQTAPDIRVQRRLGFGPGSASFLPRPGRTAFPASASGAPVRRCADAGAPTAHRPRAVCLAAALGALRSGRTSAARERGRTLPAGPGSPRSLLVALPLLIAAELVVHRRMRPLVQQFLQRSVVPESAMTRFNAAIASAFRLRNSVLAEVLLIAFVYVVGIQIVWRQYLALDSATWYAIPSVDGSKVSLAGMWYGYVSLPILQFLPVRWYFRLFIWSRFIWQVSRIELSLVPTHPDRVGGLGFLSNTVYAFALLAVAHGALLAGQLANRIFFLGATLPEYKVEIAVTVGVLICVVLGPLLVFAPQLAQAKR